MVQGSSGTAEQRLGRFDLLVCLLLVLITWASYSGAVRCDFVHFDDNAYVIDNDFVRDGFGEGSIAWAFAFHPRTYWHPLTWLSLMLDAQLWGASPTVFHRTNVLLHAGSVLLLFMVLRSMTRGARWACFFTAAVFAVHPLNVESVVWVSERKNVLSTFLWMTSTAAYVGYARRGGICRYLLVLGLFCLGLMAKPMIVTLPCVLLLLDFWPLRRIALGQQPCDADAAASDAGGKRWLWASVSRPVLEKVPMLLSAAASVFIAMISVRHAGSEVAVRGAPFGVRMANALVSYVGYLGHIFWPRDLAVFYPFPRSIPVASVVAAAACLLTLTVLAGVTWRRHPYLAVGWLWYVGTLAPMSGLVQIGLWPARADRFVYIPMIGIALACAWGIPALLRRCPGRLPLLAGTGSAVLLAWIFATRQQVRVWQNSETLFRHALAVTENNFVAHGGLATELAAREQLDAAMEHYRHALRIQPDNPPAHNNLANALRQLGRTEEARHHYRQALRVEPNYADAHYNLARMLDAEGQLAMAAEHYARVLQLNPRQADAHNNLGAVLARTGRLHEAVEHFSEALRLRPDFAEAQKNLAHARYWIRQTEQDPASEP